MHEARVLLLYACFIYSRFILKPDAPATLDAAVLDRSDDLLVVSVIRIT